MKGVVGTAESERLPRFAEMFSDYSFSQQRHAKILVSLCSTSLSPCNCDCYHSHSVTSTEAPQTSVNKMSVQVIEYTQKVTQIEGVVTSYTDATEASLNS